MPVRVVFALQAPTLLNILARSKKWRLEVAKLEDCDGLAEAELLNTERWDGRAAGVEHVFVCTPSQAMHSKIRFSKAKIWWVLHTGMSSLETPRGACNVLTFSDSVAALHKARNPLLRTSVIVPAYKPDPIWSWAPNYAWTLKNRPVTRNQEALQLILNARDGAGVEHDFFGQDWPNGFANPSKLRELRSQCSAYLSALPKEAGFGLTEHENFAMGVPVVGSRWGDMDSEMPADYWCMRDNPEDQIAALQRLAVDRTAAEHVSRLGTDFICTARSQQRMEESIERLLAT